MLYGGVDAVTVCPVPPPRTNATFGGSVDIRMHGGIAALSLLTDAWVLRGGTWTQLDATGAPPPTQGAGVVHPGRAEIVIFSAAAGTGVWVHGVPRAAEARTGATCPAGAQLLDVRGVGLPVLGNRAYAVQATGLAAQQPAALLFGGAPAIAALPGGCRLTVWPALAVVATPAANDGRATLSLPVPVTP